MEHPRPLQVCTNVCIIFAHTGARVIRVFLMALGVTLNIEEEKDRREGKGRCSLGEVVECRTRHLTTRMI